MSFFPSGDSTSIPPLFLALRLPPPLSFINRRRETFPTICSSPLLHNFANNAKKKYNCRTDMKHKNKNPFHELFQVTFVIILKNLPLSLSKHTYISSPLGFTGIRSSLVAKR
jgi:hypothetical protein